MNKDKDNKPLRGFGFTFAIPSGSARSWYVDKDGTQRWVDNDEPVPCYTVTDAGRAALEAK